jgi:peptidoglycan hydrolase-like protein with peptidoglycan-binding domain
MLRLFGLAMIVGFLSLTWAAQAVSSAKKAPVKKTAAKSSKASGKTTAGKRAPVKKVAAWRTRQSAPTPERYRQIQEALAAKGYLQPEEATGVWGPNSAEALKKFQAEQNIDSTGKINSLSLIALGLGPKRESVTEKAPAPPPAQ